MRNRGEAGFREDAGFIGLRVWALLLEFTPFRLGGPQNPNPYIILEILVWGWVVWCRGQGFRVRAFA